MNEREKEPWNQSEGRQVQQELEDQLRAFGDTMSDAFAHGFEGRGEDIGDRAYGVGRAAVHAANFGIGEAAKAFRQSRDAYYKNQQEARRNTADGAAAQSSTGMPQWARQIFGMKTETTPVENVRTSAKKRRGGGIALLAVGITFMTMFGLGAIGCFIGMQMFYETWLYNATGVSGVLLALAAAGFGWMTACGASWMEAGKWMNQFAEIADGMDYKKGLPMEMLASLTHQKKAKALKRLRKYIQKGWLSAWLDEKTETLYLTAEDYRAAQNAAAAPKAAPQPEPAAQPEPAEKAPLNLETARRFAAVLAQEQQLMQDEQARDELEHMQKTTTAICDWLEAHPESLPKARRFAEYYIPTTLKLLHTYNDVQGQQGDNAENIRRDIAGILHTLNQAYDNLYDNLLSDVAMDVSSEIAALQGMLANDGLTGREFK